MTLVLAIANHKGRVGKTTTAINLAAYLADAGRRALVVDLSPDADATLGLGIDAHKVEDSIYEVLVTHAVRIANAIQADIRPNLSLLPSKADLNAAEIELFYLDEREQRLRNALAQVRDQYDYVLIDCPSALGRLTTNALTAADGVILPLACDASGLHGVQNLIKTIKLVRDRLNPGIRLFGVVLTLYDPRKRLAKEIVQDVRRGFAKEAFTTMIPKHERLEEAPTLGLTILQHDPRSPGALAYQALAAEVIARAEGVVLAVPEETPTDVVRARLRQWGMSLRQRWDAMVRADGVAAAKLPTGRWPNPSSIEAGAASPSAVVGAGAAYERERTDPASGPWPEPRPASPDTLETLAARIARLEALVNRLAQARDAGGDAVEGDADR